MNGKTDQTKAKFRVRCVGTSEKNTESDGTETSRKVGLFKAGGMRLLCGGGATKLGAGYAFAQLAQRHVISFCFGELFSDSALHCILLEKYFQSQVLRYKL